MEPFRPDRVMLFVSILMGWLLVGLNADPFPWGLGLALAFVISFFTTLVFQKLSILFGGFVGLLIGSLVCLLPELPEVALVVGAILIFARKGSHKEAFLPVVLGMIAGFLIVSMIGGIQTSKMTSDIPESIRWIVAGGLLGASILMGRYRSYEVYETTRGSLDSEAFYQMLLAHVPIDIVVFDHEHRYLLLTEKSIKDPVLRAWMIGKDDYDYVAYRNKPITVADKRRACFVKAKEAGETISWEDHYTLPNGNDQFILRMMHPVNNTFGDLEYMVGIGWDITERKLAELKKEEALELAQKASDAKASFLSMMSHEIRTPMNAVIAMTEWMQAESPREDQKEPLEIIRFSGENLLVLINDILDFSKIEAGKIELEHRPVHLSELLENILQTHLESAREKGIGLALECPQKLNYHIITDSTRLSQILNNLISNAVKFTENGDVRIILEKNNISKSEISISIRVIDTGIGISQRKLSMIFEPFSQAENTTTRQFGGTGLGLTITNRLTQLLGGEITVSSTEGVGSEFRLSITFPRGAPLVPAQLPSADMSQVQQLEGMRILAVEDHPVNGKVLMKFLNKWQTEPHWVESGLEALQFLEQGGQADLILMDLQMPEMDGFETARRIRKLGGCFAQIPIYALSANALNDVESEVKAAGMEGFISKPFRPKNLREILSMHHPC